MKSFQVIAVAMLVCSIRAAPTFHKKGLGGMGAMAGLGGLGGGMGGLGGAPAGFGMPASSYGAPTYGPPSYSAPILPSVPAPPMAPSIPSPPLAVNPLPDIAVYIPREQPYAVPVAMPPPVVYGQSMTSASYPAPAAPAFPSFSAPSTY